MRKNKKIPHLKSVQVLYAVDTGKLEDASDLSHARKLSLVGLSLFTSLFAGGIIYGISALKSILIYNMGAFSSLCSADETLPCTNQSYWVTLTITFATFSSNLFLLPCGAFLDKFGPRISICVFSVFMTSGIVSLCLAKAVSDFLYIYGFCVISGTGQAIYSSMTNFSEVFVSKKNSIIAFQYGLYQCSSVIMLLVQVFITDFGFSFQNVFTFYLVVPFLIFVFSFFLSPNRTFGSNESVGQRGEAHRHWLIRVLSKSRLKSFDSLPSLLTQESSSTLPLISSLPPPLPPNPSSQPSSPPPHSLSTAIPYLENQNSTFENENRIHVLHPPKLYNVNLKKQTFSVLFLLLLIYYTYFDVLVNFYIATLEDQVYLQALKEGNSEDASKTYGENYTLIFNYILPVGSVLGMPIHSYVLNKLGLISAFVLCGVVNIIFLLFNFPSLFSVQWRIVGFVAFSANRVFAFGTYAACLSNIFGFSNFGKLVGLVQFSGGAFGTGTQYLLVFLIQNYLNGQYFFANLFFSIVGLLLLIVIPYYLTFYIYSGYFLKQDLHARGMNLNELGLDDDDDYDEEENYHN